MYDPRAVLDDGKGRGSGGAIGTSTAATTGTPSEGPACTTSVPRMLGGAPNTGRAGGADSARSVAGRTAGGAGARDASGAIAAVEFVASGAGLTKGPSAAVRNTPGLTEMVLTGIG